jgi:hypothetical protein
MTFPNRIVLSRKGFDSKYGGVPSPIIDGKPIMLPIPEDAAHPEVTLRYDQIPSPIPEYSTYGEILGAIKGRKNLGSGRVHLDPDISASHHPNTPQWKPMFGQCDAAQGHLERYVTEGDIFLFFGWFRNVERTRDGSLRYIGDHMHLIHGWLQIERLLRPKEQAPPYEPCEHPHFRAPARNKNIVYVGADRLSFCNLPGAGRFSKYRETLRLTAPGERNQRSRWRLPSFFCDDAHSRLTYHRDREWSSEPPFAYVRSAPIGQEFVFDPSECSIEAHRWLTELLSCAGSDG